MQCPVYGVFVILMFCWIIFTVHVERNDDYCYVLSAFSIFLGFNVVLSMFIE